MRIKTQFSTKSERRFAEILKELHIPFKFKSKIEGKEIDFIIGDYLIEIDGKRSQSAIRNQVLLEKGYNLIHLENIDVKNKRSEIKKYLQEIWQQISMIRH